MSLADQGGRDDRSVLIVGDTLTSADLRHEIPVVVADPVIYLSSPEGRRTLYAGPLDVPLFLGLGDLDVVSFEELRSDGDVREPLDWDEQLARLVVRACRREGVVAAIVPPTLPSLATARLAEAGIATHIDNALFVRRRRVKTAREIAGVKNALKATYAGWDAIRSLLVSEQSLTSEDLQSEVLKAVAQHDVIPLDVVIVPHGTQTCIAHAGGSGAILTGEPVIADLIVRDRASGCYADVTIDPQHQA